MREPAAELLGLKPEGLERLGQRGHAGEDLGRVPEATVPLEGRLKLAG